MRPFLVSAVLLLVPAGLLCGNATAASLVEITDTPTSYVDQQVTVVGVSARPDLQYLGESAYTIQGEGRSLTVFSKMPVPTLGERLQLTGILKLRPADSEVTYPPVLFETMRRSVP